MSYTLMSQATIIGRAELLNWSPFVDRLFLQFIPTAAYEAVRPSIEAMLAAVDADSPENPYDAYPAMAELALELLDAHGTVVASGAMAIIPGTPGMDAAPDHVLHTIGIEPSRPLLFLSAAFGQSLEDLAPDPLP